MSLGYLSDFMYDPKDREMLDYNDDQSEPLCICLATMILFCLTDL